MQGQKGNSIVFFKIACMQHIWNVKLFPIFIFEFS